MWQNDQYLNSPYVAVLHRKMTEAQPYVHRGPHIGYSSQKFVHTYELFLHAHGTQIRGGKVTYGHLMAIQGQGRFTKRGLLLVILPVI